MSASSALSQRARKMFALIERYQESGLTQKVFCESEGLALSTFQYWICKYKKYHQRDSSPAEAFVELKPQSPLSSFGNAIMVSYPNGVTLTVHKDVRPAFLKELISL